MLSQSKNRVQAIKNKFENLNVSSERLKSNQKSTNIIQHEHLYQQKNVSDTQLLREKDPLTHQLKNPERTSDMSNNNNSTVNSHAPLPNSSYLYKSGDKTENIKPLLTRQTSDPASKLHRRHAFRCSRNDKLKSFHREGSFISAKSDSSKNTFQTDVQILVKSEKSSNDENLDPKMEKNSAHCLIGDQTVTAPYISTPNMEVPQYILDQYAQVIKPKKQDTKPEVMIDSGVGSETENVEEERKSLKRLKALFETAYKTGDESGESKSETKSVKTNLLELTTDITTSTETMRLEKKNPHLVLTDTLKKALRQPLPSGPPPKKPPRTFNSLMLTESLTKSKKKDAKEMLHKLEQVLQERETQKDKNIYDIPETIERHPDTNSQQSNHYLCTEILNISQRSSLPFPRNNPAPFINCFNSLNCAIPTYNSTTTLPYRVSSGSNTCIDDLQCSNSSSEVLIEKLRLSTFFKTNNDNIKNNNLDIEIKQGKSQFFVPKEHIYDIPYDDEFDGKKFKTLERKSKGRRSEYGIVNNSLVRSHSKSMSDLSVIKKRQLINIKKCS